MLPTTSSMLLDALRTGEHEATWTEFDARYRPVLVAFARKLGLAEADAREIAQDVLASFVEEHRAGKYDKNLGRLRSWLFAIARARVARRRRDLARDQGRRGESAIAQVADERRVSEVWEREWRQAVLREGLLQLRQGTKMDEATVRAFEMLALEQRPVEAVAAELGMSRDSVYAAKYRAMERLRQLLERLEADW